MQILEFQEAVEIIVSKDSRYQTECYFFLRDVLNFVIKRRRKSRKENISSHVSPVELLEGFRLQLLKEFGPMVPTVLDYWGIKDSSDVGQVVFHLVEAGVLGKTANDTLDSFAHLLDFEQAFVIPFQPIQLQATATSLISSL
ncbi:MAG: hypothetical protein A3F67_05465 [Verrucomicrobia bacterium RIFCSPHIGHO2_12_FULL_41_10]|nr:MAG: hypothetical protein A3F67_05465 [Verrucomicrobia bacterium RIFCSPHIGHO2_12_FULL_41_10]HLB32601.1 Minf_1886 family protein [Chthoniobacterales bacterium]